MGPKLVPQDQGGGQYGGPRRWIGTGPRPARHIPWPELFKHHQSVLTGHLKMMDMVRKHCVEGSGNYKTAQECVARTHEMLRMFKKSIATFVPPRDNIDRVPLGASSASMYPGYSPADHIYGEAAAEYGTAVSEAKRKGIQLQRGHNGPEYIVGHSQQSTKEQLDEIKRSRQARNSTSAEPTSATEPMEDVEQSVEPEQLFTIDLNPTPVNVLQGKGKNKANDSAKRRVSFHDEQTVGSKGNVESAHKQKKFKTTKTEEIDTKPVVEEDDISAEVDARLKAKEEKRKQKEGKKRKRESASPEAVAVTDVAAPGVEDEKPKRKKQKAKQIEVGAAKGQASTEGVVKHKKKKRSSESGGDGAAAAEAEKPKKKKQKDAFA